MRGTTTMIHLYGLFKLWAGHEDSTSDYPYGSRRVCWNDSMKNSHKLREACPCCGTKPQEAFSRYQKHYLKCLNCGLYFSSIPKNQVNTYQKYAENFQREWRGEGREEVLAEVLAQLNFKSPGTLLDIGCSGGLMLIMANELGWDVSGVEPGMRKGVWAYEDVRTRISQTIDAAGGEGEFNAVTVVNVVDQVAEPWVLLKQSAQKLADDGVMIIRIPNFTVQLIIHKLAALFPGKFGSALLSSVVIHEFGLSRKALAFMLGQAGCSDVRFMLSMPSSGDTYHQGKRHVLLKRLVRGLAKVLRLFSFGHVILTPSMLVTARKTVRT